MAKPRRERIEEIMAQCRERGIEVRRTGRAYWLRGPGVDVRVSDLATVALSDLVPVRHRPGD